MHNLVEPIHSNPEGNNPKLEDHIKNIISEVSKAGIRQSNKFASKPQNSKYNFLKKN